jgi:hypothetical protein
MQVPERKARHGDFIPPYATRRRPNAHSDKSGQEQIALMQPYKGYFIGRHALMVYPYSPDWHVGGNPFTNRKQKSAEIRP